MEYCNLYLLNDAFSVRPTYAILPSKKRFSLPRLIHNSTVGENMYAPSEMYTFGNRNEYPVECVRLDGDTLVNEQAMLPRISIPEEVYIQNLEAVRQNWRVLKDPKSEQQFEVATINTEHGTEQEVDVEFSTFTSSISGNPGNAVEFAQNAAAHDARARVYVASFGNGYSSYWTPGERKYIRETGRIIGKNGEVLPTMEALARTLQAAGYIATRISTNSAGGAYGTAFAHALPRDQMTHAYFKSRPNLANHPTRLLWGLGLIAADEWQKRRYARTSNDPWKLTDTMTDEARKILSNIYEVQSQLYAKPKTFGLGKLWNDMMTFSHGPKGAVHHPAAEDTAYAIDRQPDMLTTYHMPLQDLHYSHPHSDIEKFLLATGALAHEAFISKMRFICLPGAHGDHTYYPDLRRSAEFYALNRVT